MEFKRVLLNQSENASFSEFSTKHINVIGKKKITKKQQLVGSVHIIQVASEWYTNLIIAASQVHSTLLPDNVPKTLLEKYVDDLIRTVR